MRQFFLKSTRQRMDELMSEHPREGRRRWSIGQIAIVLNAVLLFILIIMVGVAIQKFPSPDSSTSMLTTKSTSSIATTTIATTTTSSPTSTPTPPTKKDRSTDKRCMARISPPTNYVQAVVDS